jgi:alpha-tubulin suppressor-like RCC1 family protein
VCWGSDSYGQVSGVPPYLFLELHPGEEHSCGHKPDGRMACWGRNREGQLDRPLPNEL